MINKPHKKLITIFLLITVVTGFLIFPVEAQAGFSFKKLFRSIGKGVNFVVNLPNKTTRWMGPILGPIAADIMTANLNKHHKLGKLFRRLNKANKVIQSVEEQKKALADVKTMYSDQAKEIRSQVEKLEQAEVQLKKELFTPGMTFKEYEEKFIAIRDTIDVYEKAAGKFEQAGKNLQLKDVVKMAGTKILKDIMGEMKKAVIYEAGKEIEKLIDPNIISTLVSQDSKGVDGLLDLLVAGDISKALNKREFGDIDADALKEKVRERIKEMIKENKDALKDNWSSKVDEIIKDMANEIKEAGDEFKAGDEASLEDETDEEKPLTEEEKKAAKEFGLEGLFNEEEKAKAPYEPKNILAPWDEHAKDERGCLPGYHFDPKSGVGCIQTDCNKVTHAHWSFEGYCVCGTSGVPGEKPEDPNLECKLPKNHAGCPGCTYLCMKLNEKCPEIK